MKDAVYGSAAIKIDPREIKITTNTASKPYDGTALTDAGYTEDAGSDGFYDTQGFATAAANGTITNAGTAQNLITTYDFKLNTQETDYTVTPVIGTLKVTPAVLTVRADMSV